MYNDINMSQSDEVEGVSKNSNSSNLATWSIYPMTRVANSSIQLWYVSFWLTTHDWFDNG